MRYFVAEAADCAKAARCPPRLAAATPSEARVLVKKLRRSKLATTYLLRLVETRGAPYQPGGKSSWLIAPSQPEFQISISSFRKTICRPPSSVKLAWPRPYHRVSNRKSGVIIFVRPGSHTLRPMGFGIYD